MLARLDYTGDRLGVRDRALYSGGCTRWADTSS
jgi:hypothetical protein